MPGFSDAAIFHRWMSLFWTFSEPETVALLTAQEKQELDEFEDVFRSLPWVRGESHPFVSDVPDTELQKLIPSATKLLQSMEAKSSRSYIRSTLQCMALCLRGAGMRGQRTK